MVSYGHARELNSVPLKLINNSHKHWFIEALLCYVLLYVVNSWTTLSMNQCVVTIMGGEHSRPTKGTGVTDTDATQYQSIQEDTSS